MAGATQLGFDDLGVALIDATFVVLDLETTGLSPERDRITEVGAVKVRGGDVLGELQTLVRPDRPIPPAVTAVTGITDAMVRAAPPIDVVLPTVLEFLGGAVLVAHNAHFDVAFLRAAAARRGERFDPLVVDTARLARRLLRDEVRDCRLATLANHLRARTRPCHRALADARATTDVLHGLLERAGSFGATTLEELRDLTRSTSDRAYRRIGLVRDAPRERGIYRFLDARGEVLYVGKATDLRSRLRTYFGQDPRRRIADLVRETAAVDWTPTPTLLEAEVRELRAIRVLQPRYNRRSKQRDAAAHLALTSEPFPRLSVVRRPGRGHRWTVGPLASRRSAELLAAAILDVFPLRPCTPRLRRAQDHRACILKDLGRCGAPCDGSQSPASYAEVVDAVTAALADPAPLLARLRDRMDRLASKARFEEAGNIRARLYGTARTLSVLRRRDALGAVARLVATRRDGDDLEIVVVAHGRLAGTWRTTGHLGDGDAVARRVAGGSIGAGADDPDAPGPDADELGLLLAWLDRPGVRVVDVAGDYAEPVAGGAALAAVAAEARRVDRQVRQDRQVLAARKVVRRDPARTGRLTPASAD